MLGNSYKNAIKTCLRQRLMHRIDGNLSEKLPFIHQTFVELQLIVEFGQFVEYSVDFIDFFHSISVDNNNFVLN